MKDDKGAKMVVPKDAVSQALAEAKRTRKEGEAAVAAVKRRRRKRRALYGASSFVLLLCLAALLVYDVYSDINSAISGVETPAGELRQEHKTSDEERLEGIVNFIVCGIDYSDEEEGDANSFTGEDKIGNTDLILYVHYNTSTNKVNILQLPRDVYVGNEVNTGNRYKINNLYRNAEDEDNRMAALVEVLYEQYHLPVDFYVTIDMDALKEIVDIKGSIEVFVPMDISDPSSKSDAMILAGWRYLNSEQLEFYLRNRTSPTYQEQGDIKRMEVQQYFYSALFREFKDLAPQDLVMWMKVLMYRCSTDMSVSSIGLLARDGLALDSDSITFVRPPIEGVLYNGEFVALLQEEDTAALLNRYFRTGAEKYSAAELDIQTLEREEIQTSYGVSEAAIRSMGDIQDVESEVERPA